MSDTNYKIDVAQRDGLMEEEKLEEFVPLSQ